MSLRSVIAIALATLPAAPAQQDRPARVVPTRTPVYLAAFSQDGRTLTTWDVEGFTRWDVSSGRQVEREPVLLEACGRRSRVLPRSEDGVTAAVSCGGRLLFFDLATGAARGEWKFDPKRLPVVYTVSPDGGLIATVAAGKTATVQLVEARSGEVRATIENTQEVQQLSFSSGGLLATGAVDGVRLWRVSDGTLVHVLRGGTYHAFSPDGRLIAVERGRDVALFETASADLMHQVAGRASHVRFAGDGRTLAGWNNQQLAVWETETGKPLLGIRGAQLVTATLSADSVAVVEMELAGDAARSAFAIWRLR